MDTPEKFQASAADFLAAERTFLAWIRTGLALMGMGFVLARFGLFLQEFTLMRPDRPITSSGFSLWLGTALIFLSVVVCVLSLVRYLRLLSVLRSGVRSLGNASALGVTMAVLLALLGLVMSYYLISTHRVSAANLVKTQEAPMSAVTGNGVVRIASKHSVAETVAKLQTILQAKNVKLFVIVDHSGEAASAGMKMPNTKLLIFGNPQAGTPLMLASPSVAIDLPLKVLIAEDAAGAVWISYNAPSYLQQRHGFAAELLPNIAVIETLAAKAAE